MATPKSKTLKSKKATSVTPRLRDKILRRAPMSLPPEITAPKSGVNSAALDKELTALTKAPTNEAKIRTAVLEHLKQCLNEALGKAQTQFEAGRLGGLEAARLLASIHTDILRALYTFTVTHIHPNAAPKKSERLSVCAVGGFGRGEMAPGSDLDLLFLQAENTPSEWGGKVTEYILYMLWDLGLKVGQSSRSIDQCISLAKEDQTILTALLDARFISGDEQLAVELFTKFRRDCSRGSGRGYIAAKLEERDNRHKREGDSRYVIEPNIKEGVGGLRDLHVLYWIARYLDNDGVIIDPQKPDQYVQMGLFDETAAQRFVRAADFLWRTRCHLHYTAGRATEALTFDHQTKLARKMGYASGPVEVAVEKYMREYFTNAREVGALTRIACAKLEAEKALMLPPGLDRFLPTSRRALKDKRFIIDHGRLNFADPMSIREEPSQILELFQIAGRANYDLHPDALSAIDFRRNLIDNSFRKELKNAQIFLATLLESKAPDAVLKIMNEAGVLGRYLIEFGGIVGRTQFNMHHAYTVDDHTLRLVKHFRQLEMGELKSGNPIASEFTEGFTPSQRLILYMACLLHDTGKGVGDQCIEGARLSRRACRRLGLDPREIDTISWLIRRHLDMSETAQRRDISDPETIKAFAEKIGSLERLQLLMALTVVDIRAVGPGIWNDWKGALLRELYHATASYLDDKPNFAPRSRSLAAQETLFERVPDTIRRDVEPLMSGLGDHYWLSFSVTEQVLHARFLNSVVDTGKPYAVHTRLNKAANITELWVLTQDRQALFTSLTGAITSAGASITGARLHTHEDGRVFDVFYTQGTDGQAFGKDNPSLLEGLRDKTLAVAKGEDVVLSPSKPKASRRARAIPIKPVVRFEDRAAEDVVVVEVEGRDRPGLLHDLARVLTDTGLTILSAHIEVVGVMAIDVFYLPHLPGTDEWRAGMRERIHKGLLEALDPDGQDTKNAA